MTPKNAPPERPQHVDLAKEPEFRLGALLVRPSTREVCGPGWREVLEPRVMQVLVVLHQAAGKVVSREDFIARCWGGRFVGDDAINRTVQRLRRLAQSCDEPAFLIETIPRVGYRIAPDSAAPQSGATVLSAPGRRAFGLDLRFIAAGAACLLASVIATLWAIWPQPRWSVSDSRPFIANLALAGDPAFSPDGRTLAYVSGPDPMSRRLYTRSVGGGDPIQITHDAYNEASPSWSSDGTRIAYVAQKAGEPCRLLVSAVPAGATREVGRCNRAEVSALAWQPNSPFLYFVDQEPAANTIVRLDVETGNRTMIAERPSQARGLFGLRCSPDGHQLLYIWLDGYGTYRVMVRNLDTGAEKTFARTTSFGSAAWSVDSRTIFVSTVGTIGSNIGAYPVAGGPPYPIYSTPFKANHLSVSHDGLIALETDISRKNLARMSARPRAEPDIVDAANGVTNFPTFAPDGTLGFISNRSGTNAVWIMRPGSAPTQMFDAGFQTLTRLRFSPDGSRLALLLPTAKGVIVKIFTAQGANLMSFEVPRVGPGHPTWTPDGQALIMTGSDFRPRRIPLSNPTQSTPVADPYWFGVNVRPEGVFATRVDKPGVWRIDGPVNRINGEYPISYDPPMVFQGAAVLVPDFGSPGEPRVLAQPLAGGQAKVVGYAPGAVDHDDFQSTFALNPKTGEVDYIANVNPITTIDLLTLGRH